MGADRLWVKSHRNRSSCWWGWPRIQDMLGRPWERIPRIEAIREQTPRVGNRILGSPATLKDHGYCFGIETTAYIGRGCDPWSCSNYGSGTKSRSSEEVSACRDRTSPACRTGGVDAISSGRRVQTVLDVPNEVGSDGKPRSTSIQHVSCTISKISRGPRLECTNCLPLRWNR